MRFQTWNLHEKVADTFTLKHIYHQYGGDDQISAVLDMNNTLRQLAYEKFQKQMLSVNEDNVEQLWTRNKKYANVNPFNYSFSLQNVKSNILRMKRRDPEFVMEYMNYYFEKGELATKMAVEWDTEEILVPDVTDKDTVVAIALMSSNAYVKLPHTGDWRNLSDWNSSIENGGDSYGWNDNGIRGHVFTSNNDSIVVLAIKGTSSKILLGGGGDETSFNDKINDNLLFSCCCARVNYLWTPVCDCFRKANTCDERCLEQELHNRDRYYKGALAMYREVVRKYPHATVWLTGHSLGGALSSLVARTFGVPAVTFQAPGELLASKRLHLPHPPGISTSSDAIWHFGHDADPIFMGTCNGAGSACSIGGYAMESRCHSGKICTYNVVADKGWRVNIMHHRIHSVIDQVLMEYENAACCAIPEPCYDCSNWEFVSSQDCKSSAAFPSTKSLHSTSTTSTTPQTTSECVGRNWIGYCTEYETPTMKNQSLTIHFKKIKAY